MYKMSTDEFNQAMGEKLRRMREAAELSQLELAARLHVHPNTVANYEKGQGMMTVLFMRACNVLNQPAHKVLAELLLK